MTREGFVDFVTKLKSVGIDRFTVHCEEGDKRNHDGHTDFIIDTDDGAVCFHVSNNYTSEHGVFNFVLIPFDHICHFGIYDVTYEEAGKLIDLFGFGVPQIQELMKNPTIRRKVLDTSTKYGKHGFMVDENGDPKIPDGSSGYVVQ